MKYYGIALIVIVSILTVILVINKQINENINYEIIKDLNVVTTKSAPERGYQVIEKENSYYLVIYYGEVPTYYSSLNIDKVLIRNTTIKVTVSLPEDEGMGDAISYPKAIIKFDKEPKKIKISYK